MSKKEKKPFDPDKVGFGRLFAWNSRTLSIAVLSIIMGYVQMYCTDVLGMQAVLIGSIIFVSNICNGITDLIAGWIVDNTNTRWGKARPYEFCIIGVWIATACIFSTPASWGTTGKTVWLFIMYTLLYAVFYTMLAAAETPYVIRAFGTNNAIVKVSSYGGVITTLGAMIVSMVFPIVVSNMGKDAGSWRRTLITIAVPCALIGLLRFIFVKEDRIQYIENAGNGETEADEHVSVKEMLKMIFHNKYLWIFAFITGLPMMIGGFYAHTYYFNVIVGDISKYSYISMASVFLILFMFLVPVLMKKFKTIEIVVLFSALGIAGGLVNYFAGTNIAVLFVGAVGTGAACMPYSYLKSPLILQISNYNQRVGNKRMEATVASFTSFMTLVMQAFGSFVFGVILSSSGYDGTLDVQLPSVVTAIKISYSLIPAAAYAVVIVLCYLFRPIDKEAA